MQLCLKSFDSITLHIGNVLKKALPIEPIDFYNKKLFKNIYL